MGAVLEGFLLVHLFAERLLKRVWHDLRRVHSQDGQMGDMESYGGSHVGVARCAVFPHRSIRTAGVSTQELYMGDVEMWQHVRRVHTGVAVRTAFPHRSIRTSGVSTQKKGT